MRAVVYSFVAAGAGLTLVSLAGAAAAGCSSGCTSCCLPTTHQVSVPGVTVTPPTVVIQQPGLAYAGVGSVSAGASVSVDVSAQTNSQSSAQTSATAGAVSSGAVASLVSGGGGGGYFVDQGPTSSIGVITVEAPPAQAPVCLEWKAAARSVAVQAVCLDDKAVPHPASQVTPERDLAANYEGEVFRCIAGSHMQYTLGEWAGQARFEHGQTVVCDKNQALYRTAAGALQCRVQKPARDCNERSLLRRYGAGIKVAAMTGSRACVRWSGETQASAEASPMAVGLSGDGGVGR